MKKFLLVLTVLSQVVAVSFATDIRYVDDFNTQVNVRSQITKKYAEITDEDERLTNVFLTFGVPRGMLSFEPDLKLLIDTGSHEENNAIMETLCELYIELCRTSRNYSNEEFLRKYATRNFQNKQDSLIWKLMYEKDFVLRRDNRTGGYTYARCDSNKEMNQFEVGLIFTINKNSRGQRVITLYYPIIDYDTLEVALLQKSAVVY